MRIKKILFIGLNYHGYTDAVADEIKYQYECNVDYIDIQPRNFYWNFVKVFIPNLFELLLSRYHTYKFNAHSDNNYDYIFFLQAHQVSDKNFLLLKDIFSNAKFVLYNWDSLENHNYLPKVKYFDRVITFDPVDAEINNFDYLPLFCTRDLQKFSKSSSNEVFMIGNIVNPKRLDAVNAFKKFALKNNLNFKTHLRVSLLVLFKLIIARYSIKNLELKDASTSKIKSFYESSSIVFDWANHSQTGLTMRAAEALGTGKKLITNCKYLKRSEYAELGQVLVIDDRFDFSEVNVFIKSSDNSFQPNKKLYIQNFTKELFKD